MKGIKSILITLFLFVAYQYTSADSIYLNIRIFANRTLHEITLVPVSGTYILEAGLTISKELTLNTTLGLSLNGHKVRVKRPAGSLGSFDTVKICCSSGNGLIRVRTSRDERIYDDNLLVYVSGSQLIMINRVDLEKYTAGVALSEGGDAKSTEFFTIQCMISRTYALRNIRKHENEGYELCDQVHCQLYRGHVMKKEVMEALEKTRGLVILGPDTQLISAAFHSNSGGETCNSEDVWSLPAPYLKAIPDSISACMPMATWTKKIPKDKWLQFLKKKYNFPIHDKVMLDSALHFTQPHRKATYVSGIPLKELRSEFCLRSTFFSIEEEGNMLIFKGKGYGHGVGLSQEGALKMARNGTGYVDILKYYYHNISIMPFDTSMTPRKKKALAPNGNSKN
ncbi:MAG: SpoIID/LytB domain-containing protein [Bacteroidetes bacterium]|nr:SpoIID/LytB domain-containing protein [Bacteroidota bacterium]